MSKSKRKGTTSGDNARLNTQGLLVSDTMRMVQSAESRREDDRQFAQGRWPESNEDLRKLKFYVVHFQYACEIHEEPNSPKEWRPVEMAIACFGMDTGILPRFHKFIHPGKFPTGYHSDCRDRTENIHKIPHENFEMATSDYATLWRDINTMLGPDVPILYCMDEHKNIAQFCLHWIHIMGCSSKEQNRLRVFTLEDCLQDLIKRTGRSISICSITDVLQTSIYDYEPGTRCKFHEERDTINCSLATTNRWAYATCNLLSKKEFFDFELTSSHLPTVKSDKKPDTDAQAGRSPEPKVMSKAEAVRALLAEATVKADNTGSVRYSESAAKADYTGSVRYSESAAKAGYTGSVRNIDATPKVGGTGSVGYSQSAVEAGGTGSVRHLETSVKADTGSVGRLDPTVEAADTPSVGQPEVTVKADTGLGTPAEAAVKADTGSVRPPESTVKVDDTRSESSSTGKADIRPVRPSTSSGSTFGARDVRFFPSAKEKLMKHLGKSTAGKGEELPTAAQASGKSSVKYSPVKAGNTAPVRRPGPTRKAGDTRSAGYSVPPAKTTTRPVRPDASEFMFPRDFRYFPSSTNELTVSDPVSTNELMVSDPVSTNELTVSDPVSAMYNLAQKAKEMQMKQSGSGTVREGQELPTSTPAEGKGKATSDSAEGKAVDSRSKQEHPGVGGQGLEEHLTDKASAGCDESTAEPSGGKPATQPTRAEPAAQTSGGEPTAEPSGGERAAEPSGGEPTAKPSGASPTAQNAAKGRPGGGLFRGKQGLRGHYDDDDDADLSVDPTLPILRVGGRGKNITK